MLMPFRHVAILTKAVVSPTRELAESLGSRELRRESSQLGKARPEFAPALRPARPALTEHVV